MNILSSTHSSQAARLKAQWRQEMESLSDRELVSPLSRDLDRALEAYKQGRVALVSEWLRLTVAKFLTASEDYQSMRLQPAEVTTESVLGHRYLLDGIDYWLEALSLFQEGLEGEIDLVAIKEFAREGMKRLKFVESLREMFAPRVALFQAYQLKEVA